MYEVKNNKGETVATREELLYARDEAQRRANLLGQPYTVEAHGIVFATCEPTR